MSASRDCGSVPAVSVSEAGVTSSVSEWEAGHQGPAEAGTVPLGLMAAPAPALSDNSDCGLAESAEVGTVLLAEEAAIQSCAGVGVRKAVCEHVMKKRRYIGIKKAVSQGFYEETFSFQEERVQSCKECCLLREFKEKKAEEQDRKAVYEENSRESRFRAAKKVVSEDNLSRRLEKMKRDVASEQNLRRFKFRNT